MAEMAAAFEREKAALVAELRQHLAEALTEQGTLRRWEGLSLAAGCWGAGSRRAEGMLVGRLRELCSIFSSTFPVHLALHTDQSPVPDSLCCCSAFALCNHTLWVRAPVWPSPTGCSSCAPRSWGTCANWRTRCCCSALTWRPSC